MSRPTRPRVKICCIATVDEARMAVRYGASALGLVSEMPSGPGVIAEATIAEIASRVPPGVGSFLLTCRQHAPGIIEQQRRCGTNTIQLCDALAVADYAVLRAALPGIALVQVIHVTGPESVDEATELAPYVDGLLLDSGNPKLKVKELGGTGRVHNWTLSRAIRESVSIPVYLAGGLRPDNVAAALEQVGPFGLDLCSGVRTDGRLDETKLGQFFDSVEAASRA